MIYKKANKLFYIYQKLKQGPIDIEALFTWSLTVNLDSSKRTLYRYLDELQECLSGTTEELHVVESEKNKKKWFVKNKKSKDYQDIEKIKSLLLLKALTPKSFKSASIDIQEFNVSLNHLSDSSINQLPNFAISQRILNTDYGECIYSENDAKTFNDLIWAIENKRKIILEEYIAYNATESNTLPKKLTLNPVYIINHRGTLHFGFVKDGKESKTIVMPLEQIIKIKLTNVRFKEKGNQFDLFFKNRFGVTTTINQTIYDIKIEIGNSTAAFKTKRIWHPTQTFTKQKKRNNHYAIKMRYKPRISWLFIYVA